MPNKEFIIEHLIFHKLLRKYRRQDLQHLYLAVQSALYFDRQAIDVGDYLCCVLPEGYSYAGAYSQPYSGRCLPFFSYLFHIDVPEGADNYTRVYFTRRYDQAKLEVQLKIDSLAISKYYAETKMKLDKAREAMLVEYRWTDNPFGLPET